MARFVLTTNLRPLLVAPDGDVRGRGILLISGGADGKINYDDVNFSHGFGIVGVVRQFCRANDLLALSSSEDMNSAGDHAPMSVGCLKLGVVKTGIRRTFPRWMKILVALVLDPLLGQTANDAADAAIIVMDMVSIEREGGRRMG